LALSKIKPDKTAKFAEPKSTAGFQASKHEGRVKRLTIFTRKQDRLLIA